MGKEYSWEVWERAEDLYIIGGLTYVEVVAELARQFEPPTPSATQVQRKADQYRWRERREEYRAEIGRIRDNGIKARRRLVEKVLETGDPQDVYAHVKLEELALKGQAQNAPGGANTPEAGEVVIRTPSDAVAALETVLGQRLFALLSQPDSLTLAALKDFKQSLALLEDLKRRYPAADLGDDAAARQRLVDEVQQLLGVK